MKKEKQLSKSTVIRQSDSITRVIKNKLVRTKKISYALTTKTFLKPKTFLNKY